MKKIISFEKKIEFPSMIGEITSISLEQNHKFVDCNNIEGEFTVTGTYKLTEASRIEESFTYTIPSEILITESLDLDTTKIEISDFYYEIEKENILVCHIDLKIEGVEIIDTDEQDQEQTRGAISKKEEETQKDETVSFTKGSEKNIEKEIEINDIRNSNVKESDVRECDGETMPKEKNIPEAKMNILEGKEIMENTTTASVSSLFESINESEETYATYSVYLLREEETINTLIEKYKTTKEELESYNDLSNLTIGTKIIIPCHNE